MTLMFLWIKIRFGARISLEKIALDISVEKLRGGYAIAVCKNREEVMHDFLQVGSDVLLIFLT